MPLQGRLESQLGTLCPLCYSKIFVIAFQITRAVFCTGDCHNKARLLDDWLLPRNDMLWFPLILFNRCLPIRRGIIEWIIGLAFDRGRRVLCLTLTLPRCFIEAILLREGTNKNILRGGGQKRAWNEKILCSLHLRRDGSDCLYYAFQSDRHFLKYLVLEDDPRSTPGYSKMLDPTWWMIKLCNQL